MVESLEPDDYQDDAQVQCWDSGDGGVLIQWSPAAYAKIKRKADQEGLTVPQVLKRLLERDFGSWGSVEEVPTDE